jgi:hypothetical protein
MCCAQEESMRKFIAFAVIATAFCTATAQQTKNCHVSVSQSTEHNGVTVQLIQFTDDYHHELTALGIRPDSPMPKPGVLITHSNIDAGDRKANLLPLGTALAKSGAAVLILRRTVHWIPLQDDVNRSGVLMDCVGDWIIAKFNVDKSHFTYFGPANSTESQPLLYGPHVVWVPFAQIPNSEYTEHLLTVKGQKRTADWITRHMGLPKVKPEWLTAMYFTICNIVLI